MAKSGLSSKSRECDTAGGFYPDAVSITVVSGNSGKLLVIIPITTNSDLVAMKNAAMTVGKTHFPCYSRCI